MKKVILPILSSNKISMNFGMVLEILLKLCVTEAEFLPKIFFAQKINEMVQK